MRESPGIHDEHDPAEAEDSKSQMTLPRPFKRLLILCARIVSLLRRDRARPTHLGLSRVLVVEANSIGDVLVSTYAIRALLGHYPDARVDVVSTPVGQPYV